MSTRRPASALSMAPNTIARLLMLSAPTVSGSVPPHRVHEILDDAEMAVDAVGGVERRYCGSLLSRRRTGRRAAPPTSAFSPSLEPSQTKLPRSPTMRQALPSWCRKPCAHQVPVGEDAPFSGRKWRPPSACRYQEWAGSHSWQ